MFLCANGGAKSSTAKTTKTLKPFTVKDFSMRKRLFNYVVTEAINKKTGQQCCPVFLFT